MCNPGARVVWSCKGPWLHAECKINTADSVEQRRSRAYADRLEDCPMKTEMEQKRVKLLEGGKDRGINSVVVQLQLNSRARLPLGHPQRHI